MHPRHARHVSTRLALAASVALAVAGCSARSDAAADEPDTIASLAEATPAADAADAGAAGDAAPDEYVLAESDVDAYRRGRMAEMAVIDSLVTARRSARTADDSLETTFAAFPQRTAEAGARAAGMSVERYRAMTDRLERVLLAHSGSVLGATVTGGIDTTALPAEARAEMRERLQEMDAQYAQQEQAAWEGIAPSVAERLRPRVAELDSLRMTLAGMRLKVAQ